MPSGAQRSSATIVRYGPASAVGAPHALGQDRVRRRARSTTRASPARNSGSAAHVACTTASRLRRRAPERHRRQHHREPARVRQQVRDRDRRLAALAELGDQVRDRRRQREVAALDPLEDAVATTSCFPIDMLTNGCAGATLRRARAVGEAELLGGTRPSPPRATDDLAAVVALVARRRRSIAVASRSRRCGVEAGARADRSAMRACPELLYQPRRSISHVSTTRVARPRRARARGTPSSDRRAPAARARDRRRERARAGANVTCSSEKNQHLRRPSIGGVCRGPCRAPSSRRRRRRSPAVDVDDDRADDR